MQSRLIIRCFACNVQHYCRYVYMQKINTMLECERYLALAFIRFGERWKHFVNTIRTFVFKYHSYNYKECANKGKSCEKVNMSPTHCSNDRLTVRCSRSQNEFARIKKLTLSENNLVNARFFSHVDCGNTYFCCFYLSATMQYCSVGIRMNNARPSLHKRATVQIMNRNSIHSRCPIDSNIIAAIAKIAFQIRYRLLVKVFGRSYPDCYKDLNV